MYLFKIENLFKIESEKYSSNPQNMLNNKQKCNEPGKAKPCKMHAMQLNREM